MIDRIEHLAHVSVARGCGFAALAILTFFIGMSSDIVVAFKCGGYLAMLTTAVLLLKASLATRQNYRRTELWVMLKPAERPDAAIAQQIISTVLRDAYLRFARQGAILSALFLITGMIGTALQS
ncbi:MAG: hypothetical protein AB7F78_03420 [Hyphomicrobiaceae bacterium]